MPRAIETFPLFPGDASPPRPERRAYGRRKDELWLAAHFPELALESLVTAGVGEATVVTECSAGRTRVVAASRGSRALGIAPGLELSAAFALSDSLAVVGRRKDLERSKLEALAELAGRFTPVVSLEPPAALLLEIRGSLGLFGGLEALEGALADLLRRQRVTARLCAAPTALAALWLARCGERNVTSFGELAGRLSRVPLSATEWPEKIRARLEGMGIRTLGGCMRLPRGGFARRIGHRYLRELDRSRGEHDPRRGFESALRLSVHAELADETGDTAVLASVGRRLIARLVEDMRKHQVRIPGFECVLHHLSRPATVERIRFAGPTQDAGRFTSLLEDRLERIRLTAPVIALSLRGGETEPAIADHGVLFDEPRGTARESERQGLIERLRGRFGARGLYGVDLVDEHRPEAAWAKSSLLSRQERRPPLAADRTPRRPLWLLPEPRRLPSTEDGRPCDAKRAPLRLEHGPERIESGWWDAAEIGRDYYVASSAGGERLWVYRDRLSGGGWYLHGFFG